MSHTILYKCRLCWISSFVVVLFVVVLLLLFCYCWFVIVVFLFFCCCCFLLLLFYCCFFVVVLLLLFSFCCSFVADKIIILGGPRVFCPQRNFRGQRINLVLPDLNWGGPKECLRFANFHFLVNQDIGWFFNCTHPKISKYQIT